MKVYKTFMLISLVASIFATIFMFVAKPKGANSTNDTLEIINESVGQLENSQNIAHNDKYVVYNDDFAKGCKENSDCIKVQADACGCNQGGKARAILKTKQSAYSVVLDSKKEGVACVQVISDDRSCKGKPVCDKTLHTCVLSLDNK